MMQADPTTTNTTPPPPPPPPTSPCLLKKSPASLLAHPQMLKDFHQCSLADLALEIFLDLRAAACIDAAAATLVLSCFANANANEAILLRHPLVRGVSGLVCTCTSESKHAWRSMLRDLFGSGGEAVSSAVLPFEIDIYIYHVIRDCSRRGRVRVCAFIARVLARPSVPLAGLELLSRISHVLHVFPNQLGTLARHVSYSFTNTRIYTLAFFCY
jgi:hypothetical protein